MQVSKNALGAIGAWAAVGRDELRDRFTGSVVFVSSMSLGSIGAGRVCHRARRASAQSESCARRCIPSFGGSAALLSERCGSVAVLGEAWRGRGAPRLREAPSSSRRASAALRPEPGAQRRVARSAATPPQVFPRRLPVKKLAIMGDHGHTMGLLLRATMLLLLPTAAAWNLMPVGTRRTAAQVAPSRGGAPPALTVGEESAPLLKLQELTQPLGEDEAKRAWLAKQDGLSFEGGPPLTGGAAVAAPHATPPAAAAAGTTPRVALSDAQIKEVTAGTLDALLEILNQMAAPDVTTSSMTSEDAAKTAWLSKQEPQVSNAPHTRGAMLLPCPNHHALVITRMTSDRIELSPLL